VSTYLVVLDGANADQEVLSSLVRLGERDAAAQFTLLVPADRRRFPTEGECWLEAAQRANEALETLSQGGLAVTQAVVGDFMRRKAISDELLRGEQTYDEVILFTAPLDREMESSSIVRGDIAVQLQRRHQVPVRHIVLDDKPVQRRIGFSKRFLVAKYGSLSLRN
jgi:hypothetical protein